MALNVYSVKLPLTIGSWFFLLFHLIVKFVLTLTDSSNSYTIRLCEELVQPTYNLFNLASAFA